MTKRRGMRHESRSKSNSTLARHTSARRVGAQGLCPLLQSQVCPGMAMPGAARCLAMVAFLWFSQNSGAPASCCNANLGKLGRFLTSRDLCFHRCTGGTFTQQQPSARPPGLVTLCSLESAAVRNTGDLQRSAIHCWSLLLR